SLRSRSQDTVFVLCASYCFVWSVCFFVFFFFSSRRRHTRCYRDWSSDVCSSDLRQRQERLWISHNELAKGPGHPFYQRVNELLEEGKFDAFAERECAKFYAANNGRPSLVPGIYCRLLLIGYFEGGDSDGGIGLRPAD